MRGCNIHIGSEIMTSGDKLSFDVGTPTLTTLGEVEKMFSPIFPSFTKSATISLKTKGFIDAALKGQEKYAGKAYFFKGDQYVSYDWKTETIDSGYTQPLSKTNMKSPTESSFPISFFTPMFGAD